MFGWGSQEEADVDPMAAQSKAKGGAVLVDVRTEAEMAQGMIPGAVAIPLHLLPLRAESLPRDREIVLYCRSGARSAQGREFLKQMGFQKAFNLAGGVMAWERAGGAMERRG